MKEVNSTVFAQFPFFAKHFSSKTVERLIPKLREKYYLPSEIVFRAEEPDSVSKYYSSTGIVDEAPDIHIFMIKKGKVEIIC